MTEISEKCTKRILHRPLKAIMICMTVLLAFIGCKKEKISLPSLNKSQIDFGDVKEGADLEADLYFTNNLNESIHLQEIRKSCGCTSVSMDTHDVAPKQSVKLTSKLDTFGRSGVFRSKVYLDWITKDSKKSGTSTVTFLANIQTPATILLKTDTPQISQIDSTKADIVYEVKRGKSAISWDAIEANASVCQPRIEQKDKDTYEIHILLDPKQLPVGVFKDNLHVNLLSDGSRTNIELSAPITIEVTGELKSYPKSIFLGVIPEDQPIKGKLVVTSQSEDIEYISAESVPVDTFSVTCISPKGRDLTFVYSGTAQEKGNISGQLLIRVQGHPSKTVKEIAIPWIGYGK